MTDVTDALLGAAAEAARPWAELPDEKRAAALDAVADTLDAAADELVPLAREESRLPEGRLRGELVRTTFQLRSFAAQVREGFEVISDEPDPDWPTGPRPALRRVLLPLGPVVVFAASNFPFAFSVAGGDTASALAAGCPVVVKAHPGHPKLSDATAELVRKALTSAGAPEGTFALFHGEADGRDAVLDPRTKAVAFTGSLRGGRALFDLAVSRPEPIPFYGELGSVNPVFVTRSAAEARAGEIATGYVDSFTLGTGQFCTKPGLLLVPSGSRILELATEHARAKGAAALLNDRITDGYTAGLETLRGHGSVRVLVEGVLGEDGPTPTLLATTAADLLADPDTLATECFGPASLVVTYDDDEQLLAVARSLEGQLTGTVHGEESDDVARPLLAELAQRVGRVLWNGWPTGVSVTAAMHHGGPYPATTSPLHTSVGITASARFLRPVAFQNVPAHLSPR
ncbi:aldehyde dehydrogenase (NADP(+)) [Saccharomonospora cyanea]|uniref:NAD-dependent aldehyde dehydrogenase n=1 Tax=Saccharomonospora cyanea NA-134 TaxID=882082 RepID=H5XP84_9PSEU|nr:aldehyde dehydrogenase (NADP(+)) [Saccharomonospora cyanea]EHR63797.1 NAD-dependent aldehyde dehydrogenase [Saccharomonospora cyanea NA-134]